MKRSKQQGFGAAAVIAVVAVLAVIGFVGWRLYDAQQQANMQSQNNPQNTQPQTDPNEGYVVIKEWGVRFKPVEGLTGVQYFKPSNVTTDSISITTEEIAKLEPRCSTKATSMVFGLLTRSKEFVPDHGGVFAKIGDYSFQYRGSGAACSESNANYDLESRTRTAISESIKTLEAAK